MKQPPRYFTAIRKDLIRQLKSVYSNELLDEANAVLKDRNHAIFRLMLETGITPLELENLTWADVIPKSWKVNLAARHNSVDQGDSSNTTRRSEAIKWAPKDMLESIHQTVVIGNRRSKRARQLRPREVMMSKMLVSLLQNLLAHALKRPRTKGSKAALQLPVICATRLASNQQAALSSDAISNLVSEQAHAYEIECEIDGMSLYLTPNICREVALMCKAEKLVRNGTIERKSLLDFSGVTTWRSISDMANRAGPAATKTTSLF